MPNKGIIMLNGRQYGDSGTNYNVVKCTKQEYDAMTPEQKNNGCLYIVVDSAGNSVNYLSAQVAGAKTDDTHTNLLNPTLATTTINGVTCTNNGDGTFTLNGTATYDVLFPLKTLIDTLELPKTYRLCGCPSGGSGSTFELNTIKIVGSSRSVFATDRGNGATFEYPSGATYEVRIRIANGTILDNVTFKPMLTTDLSATYDDFVGYTGGTGRLNSDVAEHQKEISRINADLSEGCKLVNTYFTATTDANGNVNITSLRPDIKPTNFVSCITDNSGVNHQADPFISYRSLWVCIKEMYSGTAQKNANVALSINYTMPI